MESPYFDLARSAQLVEEGRHRELVGGLWDDIGKLQFDLLIQRGLKPHHRLLDIGCGALRGGVHFARYLDRGHYFGVEISQALLDAGRKELEILGLADHVAQDNLRCSGDFELDRFGETFDFVIAQSLFTHLGLNRVRRCLEAVADVLEEDGVFYATFFERPDASRAGEPVRHEPSGVVTHDVDDPYHYSLADLRYAAGRFLDIAYLGDWNHPRGQKLVAFSRRSDLVPKSATRCLDFDAAAGLQAGDEHYRSFVGPPDRFDFMSATQFNLLTTLGLRDRHRVLDFGCGSLRLGRLLIPYLRPGGYFGIDPARWLMDDALDSELGAAITQVKRPRFSYNDDFDCRVFGETFDVIIAQSIVTHCGPDLFVRFVASAAAALTENGLLAFSYCRTDAPGPVGPGWHYPGCVFYGESEIETFIAESGLFGCPIPWYHPGARWYVASRSPARLPQADDLRFLRGAVLHDPQFEASRR